MSDIKWSRTNTYQKNGDKGVCGSKWKFAFGESFDSDGKVLGLGVKFFTPQTRGFLGNIWGKFKNTDEPHRHTLGITIKKRIGLNKFETLIEDRISGSSSTVEKFYPIYEPGEYLIKAKNLSTGKCLPGSDSWISYGSTYTYNKNQVSGYEEPKPEPNPELPITPPSEPIISEAEKEAQDKLIKAGLMMGAFVVFFALS